MADRAIGLGVVLRNLPPELTDKSLTEQLNVFITETLGCKDWTCNKLRSKPIGFLTFLHRIDGEEFLRHFGQQNLPGVNRQGYPNARARLKILSRPVYCQKNDKEPDPMLLKTLEKAAEDREQQDEEDSQYQPHDNTSVIFSHLGFSCGHYKYHMNHLIYTADLKWQSGGIAKFARDNLIVTFCSQNRSIRVEFPYAIIEEVVVCTRPPSLTLSLWESPRFFETSSTEGLISNLQDLFSRISIVPTHPPTGQVSRNRLTEIPHTNGNHAEVLGQSLVYRIDLSAEEVHLKLEQLKAKNRLYLSYHNFKAITSPQTRMSEEMRMFKQKIGQCSATMPFDIMYQLQALVHNGILLPQTVGALLTRLEQIHQSSNPNGPMQLPTTSGSQRHTPLPFSAEAIKKLFSQVPFAGPEVEASRLDPGEIWNDLLANEKELRQGTIKGLITERGKRNLTMVYKVQVTPTRILLAGPEPEAKNRILRRFPRHTEYFARVQFCEENGQDLLFNSKVSQQQVNNRFRGILLRGIPIAGRVYNFLGFSHSSLRARAVWFMAAFVDDDRNFQAYSSVIGGIGKFAHIHCPARCAARIGQAFSETPFSVNLQELDAVVEYIPDVKSRDGRRIFSDGVGTVSRDLLEAIQDSLPGRHHSATCFQIRWAGAKGMVSLDSTLPGMVMRIRPESMVKFESQNTENLEICDVARKAIPLLLNRQMIKILEDMQVPYIWFSKLQERELTRLRKITAQTYNTVVFLRKQKIGQQIQFHQFIRRLDNLGIEYKKDAFLCAVVERAVLTEVRLLKHKTRIPVEKGATLFGVMDEFRYLEEDEVFITFDKLPGTHYADLHGRRVLVTRSPALHPGDIQLRTAVVPPFGHPLRMLSNCVVFSQRGQRDLPSQLSGGDLDGDKYNIIWDERAVEQCKLVFPPADYPRVPPLDIGRAVEREDMTDFFVTFMENDQLGSIATRHVILADMTEEGTASYECKFLAHMHSTAVDYSKTGIPVDRKLMARLKKTKYRPDFLAPAPPANVIGRNDISFELPLPNWSNQDEDDDAGPRFAYYKSEKILGKLYRQIDERKIWRRDIHLTVNLAGPSVWDELLIHVKKTCEDIGGVNWEQALGEARAIRQAYDDQIMQATIDFSEHSRVGITEVEVFTGRIFNKSGVQTRRQRDKSTQLKDEFDRISKWAETLMRKQKMKSPSDEEDSDDDSDVDDIQEDYDRDETSQGASALELSIACLNVGIDRTRFKRDARRGDNEEFHSFKVVAAHCVLRELELAVKQAEIAAGAALMGGGFPGVSSGRD
ncbi:rna-dependent rna polymerase [Xylariomycetidae sp. FL0641]|nr:rna-dependent rna polymerase [Xylariomycetidae sp. FL0641]